MHIYNNGIAPATSQHYIWQPIANKLYSRLGHNSTDKDWHRANSQSGMHKRKSWRKRGHSSPTTMLNIFWTTNVSTCISCAGLYTCMSAMLCCSQWNLNCVFNMRNHGTMASSHSDSDQPSLLWAVGNILPHRSVNALSYPLCCT